VVAALLVVVWQSTTNNAATATLQRLSFMCGSTCFGRFLAHHQELTTALAASGFTVGVWW